MAKPKNANIAKPSKPAAVQVTQISARAQFSGPLPHPSTLQGYESIIPGAAERILAMAEKQQNHDISHQMKSLSEFHKNFKRGQNYGFYITALLIMGGLWLVVNGQPISGTIFGCAGLSSVILAFLGKQSRDKKSS